MSTGYEDIQVDASTVQMATFLGLLVFVDDHYELTEKGSAWLDYWMTRQMPKALIKQGWPMRHDHFSVRMVLRGLIKLAKIQRRIGFTFPPSA